MKHVIFATGSDRKIQHMRQACKQYGITVEQQDFAMDEIQAHDPQRISEHKAAEAFRIGKGKPVVINDAYWSIPALNGFPGGYMKDVTSWFTPQDWIDLVANKTDKRICITETVIYKDAKTTKSFTRDFWLEIIDSPYEDTGDVSITRVAAVDGMTIAEAHQQHKSLFRAYIWRDFAEWFAAYEGPINK